MELVSENAIEKAARASFYRVDSSVAFEDLPEAHREGWLASAKAGLEAAAPLIVAAYTRELADQAAVVAQANR